MTEAAAAAPPPDALLRIRVARLVGLGWLLVVAASACIGLRYQWHAFRARPRVPFAADSSIDAQLARSAPGLSSRQLQSALAEVAPGGAVAFVGFEDNDRYYSDLYTVSELALPLQVPAIACRHAGRAGIVTVTFASDARIVAALYDGVTPPPGPGRELAPGVWWRRLPAPLPARSQWTSLCSS